MALKNELVFSDSNKYIYAGKVDALQQEMNSLDVKIQQVEETLDSLEKLQHRWVERFWAWNFAEALRWNMVVLPG